MNREIKFRAWDKNREQIVTEGGFIQFDGNGGFEVFNEPNSSWDKNGEDANDLILMQFTGLLDKNGKKVFEGDLVTIYDSYNACTAKGVAEVKFSYEYVGGWVASSNGKDALTIGTRMNLIEVVGNSWDIRLNLP